jgi:nucleotide-binding universal stress UspA family protein
MRRILVASDLSGRADRAVQRAIQLAGQHGASLTVVHVVDDELPQEIARSVKAAAGEKLSAMVSGLGPSAGIELSVKVADGQAHASIVGEAAACGADLIVLGIHRNANARFPVVGSTMGRVVRECSVPVLVAMLPADGPYRKAVVGVDFSAYTEPAIAAAAVLAPDGEIELVHAFHVPFAGFLSHSVSADELASAYRQDLSDLVGKPAAGGRRAGMSGEPDACRFRASPVEGEVRAVLRDRVSEIGADLLVLGSHGRSGLARVWLGSVAEHFLVHPPCDVLVVKA